MNDHLLWFKLGKLTSQLEVALARIERLENEVDDLNGVVSQLEGDAPLACEFISDEEHN